MATPSIGEALEGALRALKALDAGHVVDYTIGTGLELKQVETFLGLKRPLASYAPRTRRRYIAAARSADSGARRTLARERQMKKTSATNKFGVTPSQMTKLNKLRVEIETSGIDIREYLDDQVVKDMIQMYGYKYLVTVWTEQIESIKAYTQGRTEPGRTRWFQRGDHENHFRKQFGAVIYYARGTDPYYYYHGVLN